MAACGESNYSNWLSESLQCPSHDGSQVGSSEEDLIIEAVKKELSNRYTPIDDRVTNAQKIVSSRRTPTPTVSSSRNVADESSLRPKTSVASNKKKTSVKKKKFVPPPYQSQPQSVDKGVSAYHTYDTSDSDTSDVDTASWDMVKIRREDADLSTLSSGRKGGCCKCKLRWILLALLIAIVIAAAVTIPLVLINERNKRNSNSSAILEGYPTNQLTFPPTAAPVQTLPPSCEPIQEEVSSCFTVEMTQEQADTCVDCVWEFLPDKTGLFCEEMEERVCEVVQACGCLTCQDELVSYLDCQTECEFDCTEV